jgi:hypothetical protein
MKIIIRIGFFISAIAIIFLWSLPASAQVVKLYDKGNVLVGANFNDGPGSSDMTLIMQLSSGGKIFVDEGAPVKYLHEPDNKDIKGWTKVDFDDKKWKDGFSGVGFSDGDDNTTTPAGITSIWTRYRFDVPNASSVKELTLLVDYDDAYIAWINGVEVGRSVSVTAKGLKVGDEPAWNFAAAGIANRGSCELVAGKPNKDRWKCAQVEKAVIKTEFGGPSPLPVEPAGKLATMWGQLKNR